MNDPGRQPALDSGGAPRVRRRAAALVAEYVRELVASGEAARSGAR